MITPADGGTRDPAEIKHPLTPSEVTQRVTLSQTSGENHSFKIFTHRYVINGEIKFQFIQPNYYFK